MSKPVIHVTNAASRRLHGPGRLFHILRWPPTWLVHSGGVDILRPHPGLLAAFKDNRISAEDFQEGYAKTLDGRDLRPGSLAAYKGAERHWVLNGDTLVCVCSKVAADMGQCHRTNAAGFLHRAGWRVVLDGQEIF